MSSWVIPEATDPAYADFILKLNELGFVDANSIPAPGPSAQPTATIPDPLTQPQAIPQPAPMQQFVFPSGFAVQFGQSVADGLRSVFKQDKDAKNYAAVPSVFSGDRTKYEAWRQEVIVYVDTMAKDNQKIRATLSYMKGGDAGAWNTRFFALNSFHLARDNVTWDYFLGLLDKQFRDPRQAEHARTALMAKKFRDGQENVLDWFVIFDELREKGQMSDAGFDTFLVEHLKRTLPQRLMEQVEASFKAERNGQIKDTQARLAELVDLLVPTNATQAQHDYAYWRNEEMVQTRIRLQDKLQELDQPITYDEFRKLAIDLAPTIERYKPSAPKAFTPYRTTTATEAKKETTSSASPNKPGEPDVKPMDLSRARGTQPRTGGPRCFKCGQQGHIRRDCPQKEGNVRAVQATVTDTNASSSKEDNKRFEEEATQSGSGFGAHQ